MDEKLTNASGDYICFTDDGIEFKHIKSGVHRFYPYGSIKMFKCSSSTLTIVGNKMPRGDVFVPNKKTTDRQHLLQLINEAKQNNQAAVPCVPCDFDKDGNIGGLNQDDIATQNLINKYMRFTNAQLQKFIDETPLKGTLDYRVASDILEERNAKGINITDPEGWIGPFEGQYLVYSINGVRGRHIDVYEDKVVINTKVTIGSILTHNATDGEKTIYFSDCIGIQFKPSRTTIGYLQIETASSSGNNRGNNFFNENSFTYDTSVISNRKMEEVANYVKKQIDIIKKSNYQPALPANNNTNPSLIADELIKLKQLVDMGVLTQEEFDAKKKQLLDL